MRRLLRQAAWPLLLSGFAGALLASAAAAESVEWRQANDAVGQFRRGHADVLKWENANAADPARQPPAPAGGLELMSADEAVRLAWQAHRDLTPALAVLDRETVARLATGRLKEIELEWLRRVPDLGEIVDVASSARLAWLKTVAAGQTLRYRHEALLAVELAAELGERMRRVGNWSDLQAARVRLALNAARRDLARAEYAHVASQAELLGVLRLTGTRPVLRVADALPELPGDPYPDADLSQRLSRVADALPRGERLRLASRGEVALAAYRAAYEIARAAADSLQLQNQILDETVLHYNGMLKSVWELLEEARKLARTAIEASDARRDFWSAESDLQAVMLGILPERFVSLAGSGGEEAAAAH